MNFNCPNKTSLIQNHFYSIKNSNTVINEHKRQRHTRLWFDTSDFNLFAHHDQVHFVQVTPPYLNFRQPNTFEVQLLAFGSPL